MTKTDIVGMEAGTITFPVERGKIHEFAGALRDENPVYHDPQAAKEAGFPDVIAPPTFTVVQQFFTDQVRTIPDLGLDYARVLHGEQEFEYVRPVAAGDTLTGRTRVSQTYEKEGKRGGTMRFVVLETTYTNQRGEECVITRMTLIETAKAAT